jgi:hypothetical protein
MIQNAVKGYVAKGVKKTFNKAMLKTSENRIQRICLKKDSEEYI